MKRVVLSLVMLFLLIGIAVPGCNGDDGDGNGDGNGIASFSVSNLTIEPTEVAPNKTVAISVSVANTGGSQGSYNAVLNINGVQEATESVTIAASASETVTFSVTREDAGSYTVAVGGLSGSFTVIPTAGGILEAALAASAELNTYLLDLSTTKTIPSQSLTVAAVGSGAVDGVAEKMYQVMQITVSMPGIEMQGSTEMYVVDGWQYTRMEMPGMPSYWQKSRVSEDDLEKRDITTLVTDFSEVELLGSEMVNGTECYKLRVTPDTERLWQWSQTLEGTEGLDPTLSPEEVISDFSLIVWVAKDTYFPAKISVEITMTIEGEAMGMVMTMLIHHINEPVTIELPPEAEAAEPTNGDEGKPTVVAPRLQNPVTLDGEISGNEWDDAGQLSVTFVYTDDGSSLTYPGTIYFKHDGTYLWICIRVQDDDENRYPEMYDYAAILFDASGDGDIGPGDDSAIIHHGLGPVDLRPGEDEVWRSDTEFGGNSDVVGQSGWAAGWYTYEMRKPLNSGDTNGYDIAISPGDTILSSSSIWDAGEATAWSADAGSFYIRLEP